MQKCMQSSDEHLSRYSFNQLSSKIGTKGCPYRYINITSMFCQFPNSSTWQFLKWSRDCAPKPFQPFNLASMKMSTIVCASRNCYLRDQSYLWLGKLIELGTAIILPGTVIPLPAELLLQKDMMHVMLRNTLEFTSISSAITITFPQILLQNKLLNQYCLVLCKY